MFEVNTKNISSSVLKTSEFSLVRSMSKNSDVINSQDEIYLIFTEKSKFSFYFILLSFLYATCNVSPTEKGCAENAKSKIFSKPK